MLYFLSRFRDFNIESWMLRGKMSSWTSWALKIVTGMLPRNVGKKHAYAAQRVTRTNISTAKQREPEVHTL